MFQKSVAEAEVQRTDVDQSQDAVETVVGPSVVVEGDFNSEGNIVVKGTVSGSVHTSRLLTVEEGAKIFAHVKAESAVVAGMVKGNVKVGERLELTGTARVAGDIECKVLVVEAGALIAGKILMAGMEMEEGKPEKKTSFGRIKAKVMEKEPEAAKV